MRSHQAGSGFTLIELMIVLLILGVVTVQVLGVHTNQVRVYSSQKQVLEAQSDARLASDLIFHDTRMAGFMVPTSVAVSSVDGGNASPDMLCVSDSSVLDDTQVDLATDRFESASVTMAMDDGDTSVSLQAAELDIDGDGDDDFALDRGIIIADGTSTHCARITSIAGGNIGFTPATPALFVANPGSGGAVPAVVYEQTVDGLTRNTLLVSQQVEDVQVEFGVDIDNDGQLGFGEFPIHVLNGKDPSRVRIVRLSVLTRTMAADLQLSGPGRQRVANRDEAGVGDAFRRRLVTVSAAPRNLM